MGAGRVDGHEHGEALLAVLEALGMVLRRLGGQGLLRKEAIVEASLVRVVQQVWVCTLAVMTATGHALHVRRAEEEEGDGEGEVEG